jgi:hypothetical protein
MRGRIPAPLAGHQSLAGKPAPPAPPAKADIKVVAADIKKELAGYDDRDLEFLARLFEDDRIIDTGSGNELANRLNTILAASSDGSFNGVTHFAGIYAGVTDLGFRKAFKDPFPGKSDNQVGHFTDRSISDDSRKPRLIRYGMLRLFGRNWAYNPKKVMRERYAP